MTRRLAFFLMLFSLWLASATFARAETIVLAVPGPGSLVYLPVQLAKAIEADKAEGLDLKLRFFSGGPLAMRDLRDNNSDFAVVGLPAIASARADKMPVVAIGQLSQSAMVTLLLRHDLRNKVHNVAQLKGMRIGVNTSTRTARSTSQMLTEYLIRRAGLNAADVQIIPAGQNREAQRDALVSQTIDAIMGDEPFATELVAGKQAIVLANLYEPKQSAALLGGPFVHAALATREDVAKLHPETVKKVQRMFDRTLEWLAHHYPREVVEKLHNQAGFDVGNPVVTIGILQKNAGMYPKNTAWDQSAITTTERFFHEMAQDANEAQLRFADFILISADARP